MFCEKSESPRRATFLQFAAALLTFWSMSTLLDRITISPDICHGKPVIRNRRYPVEAMLEYLSAGDTFEDLLEEFPDLEREDLQACIDIEYATRALKMKTHQLVLA